MTRPASEQPARILLVEGQNDRHVVLHLCNRDSHFQIIEPTDSEESDAPYVVILPKPSSSFHIMVTNGINNLLDSIGPQIIVPDRQAVGILVDANDDFTARWDAVANRLSQEGIDPPASPDSAGTIIDTESKPRVGIWLMPDNTSPGELEDFVVQMIPAGDFGTRNFDREIMGTMTKFSVPKECGRCPIATLRRFRQKIESSSRARHREPSCMPGWRPGKTLGKWAWLLKRRI